jgi:hypothetical protein
MPSVVPAVISLMPGMEGLAVSQGPGAAGLGGAGAQGLGPMSGGTDAKGAVGAPAGEGELEMGEGGAGADTAVAKAAAAAGRDGGVSITAPEVDSDV